MEEPGNNFPPPESAEHLLKRPCEEADDEESDIARHAKMRKLQQAFARLVGRNATHVTEIFSPPRVTAAARDHNLRGGHAFDVQHGWDASDREHVRQLLQYIDDEAPLFVNGSPPMHHVQSTDELEQGQNGS